MTIAYFDCFAGISGDMTLGALIDAGADRAILDATVEALRLGDEVTVEVRHEERGHAGGTRVDLVGAFWLLHNLSVGQVYASALPAPTGRAGQMPLPAPASVRVLEGTGAVFVSTDETRELVTPTGAAILAVAARFTRPAMSLQSIGYGIGSRDVPGNALAVWIGDEVATQTGVTVIETNIDDMAPNLIAALGEDLMALGALDVSVLPVVMKKGRAGHLLAIMAAPDLVAQLTEHVLRHSTTLGVRLTKADRVIAERRVIEVRTAFGIARAKVKELGGKAVD